MGLGPVCPQARPVSGNRNGPAFHSANLRRHFFTLYLKDATAKPKSLKAKSLLNLQRLAGVGNVKKKKQTLGKFITQKLTLSCINLSVLGKYKNFQ